MNLRDTTVQVLVLEEIFYLLENKKLTPGEPREEKRKILKTVLNTKQKDGRLEVLERMLWCALLFEKYPDQVGYVRGTFKDLKRRASQEFRQKLEEIERTKEPPR